MVRLTFYTMLSFWNNGNVVLCHRQHYAMLLVFTFQSHLLKQENDKNDARRLRPFIEKQLASLNQKMEQ